MIIPEKAIKTQQKGAHYNYLFYKIILTTISEENILFEI